MQNTAKALAALREHWKAEGMPSVTKIAKTANISNATAYRYLSGATKGGMPETIRALAIAMDRRDIADSIPYTGINGVEHTEDYIVELSQQWQEKFQQQLTEVTTKHKQEMDDLTRDHRLEREDWHAQRKAMHQENANLRASFDNAVNFRDEQLKIQRIEKWIFLSLFLVSIVLLFFVK